MVMKIKKGKADELKKAQTLTEFKEQVAAKKPVDKPTFYRQLFYDRCMVCVYDFKMRDENFASCDQCFGIRPGDGWIRACKNFFPDQNRVEATEKKLGVKVTPFVQADWEHRDKDWLAWIKAYRHDLLTPEERQEIEDAKKRAQEAAQAADDTKRAPS